MRRHTPKNAGPTPTGIAANASPSSVRVRAPVGLRAAVTHTGASLEHQYVLQAVLESPKDIVIIALDRAYRYLAFNEAHRRVMQQIWNVDIRVGLNMLEVVGRDDDRERAKHNFDRALGGEHFTRTEEFGDEALGRRYFEDVYGPIVDARGEVIGLTIYLTDVTERTRARQRLEQYQRELERSFEQRTIALRRNEEIHQNLVQNAPIAAMVHRGHEVLLVNPATTVLLGEPAPERLVGRSLAELASPEIAARLACGERFTGTEVTLTRADGETVIVEWTSIPVELDDGAASYSLLLDVTARHRAQLERARFEEQMRHTQKLEGLGVLAGGIAHDFNNLLVGILGNVGGALRRLQGLGVADETLRQQLERIRLSSQRAAELTHRLLAYAGKGAFALQPLDLNAIAGEMRELLAMSLSGAATLRYELATELPPVLADAAQLRQLAMNLVTNAADAVAGTAGSIVLRTAKVDVDAALLASMYVADGLEPGPFVMLEVRDTGVGMASETLTSIFDPFFTTKEAGRGLGLAATLGIVRSHGGGLCVESELGRGSSFRVYVPASAGRVPPSAAPPHELDEWRGSGTVLIADDQRRVRDVLRMLLRELGFDVLEVDDATSCLARFREHRSEIRLVLVDLMMPGGGGRHVVSALRGAGETVPILISSGYTEEAIGDDLRADPRVRFLEKPFILERLVEELRYLLGDTAGCRPPT